MSDNNLRSRVIRLAHQNPFLRPHLLPLVKKTASRGTAIQLDTARLVITSEKRVYLTLTDRITKGLFRVEDISKLVFDEARRFKMKAPVKLQSQNPEEEVIWGFYAEEYDDLVEFMRGLADRIDLILELNTEPYTNYKHLLR